MTTTYPIVFEVEASGAVSAYVIGLPVYAAADTRRQAERTIIHTLGAYLKAHPTAGSAAVLKVASVEHRARTAPEIRLVGPAALVATRTSKAKALASRANRRTGVPVLDPFA